MNKKKKKSEEEATSLEARDAHGIPMKPISSVSFCANLDSVTTRLPFSHVPSLFVFVKQNSSYITLFSVI